MSRWWRPSESPWLAAGRLALSIVLGGAAAWLLAVGTSIYAADSQALAATVAACILAPLAVINFVLALRQPKIARVMVEVAKGLVAAFVLILAPFSFGFYGLIPLIIAIGWLWAARRGWPRPAFRRPRLRREALEPPPHLTPSGSCGASSPSPLRTLRPLTGPPRPLQARGNGDDAARVGRDSHSKPPRPGRVAP